MTKVLLVHPAKWSRPAQHRFLRCEIPGHPVRLNVPLPHRRRKRHRLGLYPHRQSLSGQLSRFQSRAAKAHLLSDGAFFGEISLILPHLRRVASVYADSYCYLYTLTVEEFNEALNEFPAMKQHFITEAGKRLDNMKMAADEEDLSTPITPITTVTPNKLIKK